MRITQTNSVKVSMVLSLLLVIGAVGTAEAEAPPVTGRPVVDAGIPSYQATGKVSGGITIAGSDTMQPIIAKIASYFKQWQPDVKIAVQGGGSDAALRAFVQGIAASRRGDGNVRGHLSANDVNLLASSRRLTPEERKEFQSRYGYEPVEIPIALDAVALYVNHTNPIQGLTMEQVDAMFGRTRKRGLPDDLTTWGQVGLQNGWEQLPIHLYGRDKRSGTRTFFVQEALAGGELKSTVREEPGPAMEILDISRDLSGIGYAGIGFQASTVRVLPLAEKAGMPFVPPTSDSAANGTYPLARALYLYANKAPKDNWEPEVLEFLKFVNSREGQEAVLKAGVYPLTPAQVQSNRQVLTGDPLSATAVTPAGESEIRP